MMRFHGQSIAEILALAALLFFLPTRARSQGGPPLLTNDPGTPGPESWEINIATMPIFAQGQHQYQIPQLDINYGVGKTIQLTVEIPYVLETMPGQPQARGWSNGSPGVKWRFIDDKHGWNVSVFPQIWTPGPAGSVRQGIADNTTRLLLPIEVQRNFGPIELNAEAGYYFPFQKRGHEERTIGFAAGHQFTKKLEIIGEVYNDSAMDFAPHDTTWDAGGRYEFHAGLIGLAVAGRSFSGAASGEPTFFGYFGIQILLDRNGRTLHADD